jgi:hypothetical protein
MSVGQYPKDSLVMNQALKVENLKIRGSDSGLYSLTQYTSDIMVFIREPVQIIGSQGGVYLASLKVDSSNTTTSFAQSSISIVDSNSSTANPNTLSGINEFGVAVSDQGAILITGVTAMAANDVLSLDYCVQPHL